MNISVELKNRSYKVYIDESESLPKLLKNMFPKGSFVVITNKTLEKLYSNLLSKWQENLNCKMYIIEDGESYKTLDTWKGTLDFLLESRLDRNTVILAFGGGVIGDISGFVSSTFLRGVSCVQIPTTFLAMVDSSIGGKTGVNHPKGKNLIGTFHQPKMVWINTEFLKTLPQREFISGYAEVYKYAFIGGREMFDFILTNHEKIMSQEKPILNQTIKKCIEIKANIVSKDEKESGKRELLNLGHTFGHAIEHYYNFKGIIHGESVYWGTKCAIELGKSNGTILKKHYSLYDKILSKQILPPLKPKPIIKKIYSSMFSDKKVRDGNIRFILPTEPGFSIVKDDIPEKQILNTLKKVLSKS